MFLAELIWKKSVTILAADFKMVWRGACAAEKTYSELIHRCKVVSPSNIKRAPEEKQEKRILGKLTKIQYRMVSNGQTKKPSEYKY